MSHRRFGLLGSRDNWIDNFFDDVDDDFFRPNRRRRLVEWSDTSSENSSEDFGSSLLDKKPSSRSRKSSDMSFKSEEKYSKESSSRSSSSTGKRLVNSSPRVSNLSGTNEAPTPPAYDEVMGFDKPIKDYFQRDELWDRNIDSIVDDFDKKCTQSLNEHKSFTNTNSRLSSDSRGFIDHHRPNLSPAQQHSLASETRSSTRRISSGASPLDMREIKKSSRSSAFSGNTSRILQLSPFMTSRLNDRESLFNRKFGEWGSVWPEITFPDWDDRSYDHTRSPPPPIEKNISLEKAEPERFVLHIDVHGFNHDELIVKTEGQTLVVIAQTKSDPNNEAFSARELKKEFELPLDVNPLDVVSSLSPEGYLLVEANRTMPAIEAKPQ